MGVAGVWGWCHARAHTHTRTHTHTCTHARTHTHTHTHTQPPLCRSRLGLQSPPTLDEVVDNLAAVTPARLEAWSLPESVEDVFGRVYTHLDERWAQLSKADVARLR
jgi:hypothetical protein